MNKLTTLKLKPLLISSLFFLGSLTATAGFAEEYSPMQAASERQKDETKGILTGAVIGGLLAGPPGAIFLAGIGGMMGNNKSVVEDNARLLSTLDQSQSRIFALEEQHEELLQQYQLVEVENQTLNFISTSFKDAEQQIDCCQNSELAVHFKTNSVSIEDHYQAQLEELAKFAEGISDVVIEINGYADRRGTSNENYLLSQNRVKTVQNQLITMGISHRVIHTSAYGENNPLISEDSFENDFFDRRVNIQVHAKTAEMITQND